MTHAKSTCRKCGSHVDLSVNQIAVNGALRWGTSYRCGVCGNAVEVDGEGPPPAEIRQALLAIGGEWGLLLNDRAVATKALQILREMLSLSLSEVLAKKTLIPGVVARGTKVEMERLQAAMTAAGIPVLVVTST